MVRVFSALFSCLVILCCFQAHAQPDIVRIGIGNSGADLTFSSDHDTHSGASSSDPLLRFETEVHCQDGVEANVAFTNKSDREIQIVSSDGFANLAAENDFGPHSATFRSVPKGRYVLAVRDLQANQFKAVFQLICHP